MSTFTPLIIDTETSGIPQFRDKTTGKAIPADAPGQPRIASIAAILLDTECNELERMHYLIAPEGWTFDNDCEAAKINGHTHEQLMDEGIPMRQALEHYDELTDRCDLISGYSVAFDQKMIRAEYRHAGMNDRYGERPTFDTMYRAQKVARAIPGTNPKIRKLTKVYEAIFGKNIETTAHGALADCEAHANLFRYLLAEGLVEARPQVSKR